MCVPAPTTPRCTPVNDTGRGFTKAAAERLVQPFVQVREPSSVDGTGLGLFISAGIAQAYGGTLTAHRTGPGEGAAFTLRLPRRPHGKNHDPSE